jgi:hypothetical protein
MDLFSANAPIEIDVHYVVEKNKAGYPQVIVLEDDVAAKMRADEKQKDRVKSIRTMWRPQSWQAANELLIRSQYYNPHTREQDIDWTKYRDARLKSCLVDWDAKTDKGEKVPCVEANINKLHAAVAIALLDKYDATVAVDKDALQKN